ncbi:AAA-like domain-containing protein [Acaryochloris marina NIES-2412]|uniref:AAA-like domain-containing protein n=1 Tax=Acaryochloris marina TaxID=155978 RepID=UPI004059AABD
MAQRYLFSGSLAAHAQNYVVRAADDELYEALLAGQFCYVLNSRQTGKSSLSNRTQKRLSESERQCVTLDLSHTDVKGAKADFWYLDLLRIIAKELFNEDSEGVEGWWLSHTLGTPLMRFRQYMEEQIFPQLDNPLILFIDEIDSVLSLPFNTDDFFAYIRACQNRRALDQTYNQLTFCLLGVASPNTLIQDPNRTPFNIGQAIDLKGFQLEETGPLQTGFAEFEDRIGNPQELLAEILSWTGGQPFLTQKVCFGVYEALEEDCFVSIEAIVQSQILENWAAKDTPVHLKTIENRMLAEDEYKGIRLELYRQVLTEGSIPYQGRDEEGSLMLTGGVTENNQRLECGNRIYERVFSEDWVEIQLQQFRPYHSIFTAWMGSGGRDTDLLLRGVELKAAKDWAEGRSLAQADYRFINASQELARAEAISAEEEAKAALERIRLKELEAQDNLRKSNRRLKVSFGVMLFAVPIAIASLFITRELSVVQAQLKARNDQLEKADVNLSNAKSEVAKQQRNITIQNSQINTQKQVIANSKQQLKRQNTLTQYAKKQAKVAAKNALIQKLRAINARNQANNARSQAQILKQKQASLQQRNSSLQLNLAKNRQDLEDTKIEKEEVALGINLERQADLALREESQLDGLLLALNLGEQLQNIVSDGRPLSEFPAIQPIYALNSLKDTVLEKNRLIGHQGSVASAVYSPDGQHILTLMGHQGTVRSDVFSPDGQHILTASGDNTARVWDQQGHLLHTLMGHQSWVSSAVFSPDGQHILTASNDKTARVWSNPTLIDLLGWGCNWVEDYLTMNLNAKDKDKQMFSRIRKNLPQWQEIERRKRLVNTKS